MAGIDDAITGTLQKIAARDWEGVPGLDRGMDTKEQAERRATADSAIGEGLATVGNQLAHSANSAGFSIGRGANWLLNRWNNNFGPAAYLRPFGVDARLPEKDIREWLDDAQQEHDLYYDSGRYGQDAKQLRDESGAFNFGAGAAEAGIAALATLPATSATAKGLGTAANAVKSTPAAKAVASAASRAAPYARKAVTAARYVMNPWSAARGHGVAGNIASRIAPFVATAGGAGPHVLRALPKETLDKIPDAVKSNLAELQIVSPVQGLLSRYIAGKLTDYALSDPLRTAELAGKAVDAAASTAGNYVENSKDVPVVPTIAGYKISAGGGAKDKIREKAESMPGEIAGGVLERLPEKAREIILDTKRKLSDLYNEHGPEAKEKLDEILAKVEKARAAFNEIPEPFRSAIQTEFERSVFDAAVKLTYPNYDISGAVADANDFYNEDVLPRKQMYAGEPGKDYDPRYYVGDMMADNANIVQDIRKNIPIYGYTSPMDVGNKIHLNTPRLMDMLKLYPEMLGSTLVHEGTHLTNRDSPYLLRFGAKPNSGLSDAERRKLKDAYGFDDSMMRLFYGPQPKKVLDLHANAEAAAVNREFRYAVRNVLKEQLGRNPTFEELNEYIDGLSTEDIENVFRNNVHNGYVDYMRSRTGGRIDRRKAEALRRAWKEVARNGRGYGNGYSMA